MSSSPIYISDDDDSFDPEFQQDNSTSDNQTYTISDDENEIPEEVNLKKRRQDLVKILFPNVEQNGSTSRCSKSDENNPAVPEVKKPDYEKMIGGVSVHLPVNPYPSQVAVMFKVITAIKKNQNCLLESPTGTGKTLALLCSALAWQKNEKERLSMELAKSSFDAHPELQQLDGALEFISSPDKSTVGSPEEFFSKRVHGERNIYESPQKVSANDTTVHKRYRDVSSDSTILDSEEEGLVKLQKKMRHHPDSSPELPSTPEKCIAVPKVETPPKIRELYTLVEHLRVRTSLFVGCSSSSPPTIYYGTRTHKQIQQVVKEFARTAYCGSALMSILSSREHSCIRKFDKNQWRNKNEMCSDCIKPLSAADKLKLQTNQDTNCKYYDNRKALIRRAVPPAFDLKDLVTAGENIAACPYYGAREMAKSANIVFCPYNYLIEPAIRKSMQIDLTNNVVIIDEGHNIEDICRDAVTCNFTKDQVNIAFTELTKATAFRYANGNMMSVIEHLLAVLANWNQWFENQMPLINNQAVNGTEAILTWQVENFVQTLSNHNLGPKQYSEFHQKVETFCRKFREDSRTLIGVTLATSTLLESLDTVLGFLFRDSCQYMDDFKPVLIRKIPLPMNGPNAWRSLFNKGFEKESLTLRLICMNPAIAFEGLRAARCVILASGTLTPHISMESELATDFPLKISARHIIDHDRVWIGSLWRCPDGDPLDCTSRGTTQPAVQDALGAAVLRVCRVTPHGVLCFFPSYQRMNALVQRWRQIGMWQELEQLKHVFMESNNVTEHDTNMQEYYECVRKTKGATLFAVYRGKVAEGMDFKDHQARAVITVGLPYPNKFDLAVSEKMKYNDKYSAQRNLLSGSDWYLVQAYRALNQAVGRCVRHRGDWGAVLLADERFRAPHYTRHLSAWVNACLGGNHHTFNSLFDGPNNLKSFMEKMSSKENE